MKKHPDFEGALADIFNEYELDTNHLAIMDGDFRADFARHVARRLRDFGIGLHIVGEPDSMVMDRDNDLARWDAFLRSLLNFAPN